MSLTTSSAAGVEVRGTRHPRFDEVLTPAALDFVAGLQREFNPAREALLGAVLAAWADSSWYGVDDAGMATG